MFCYKQEKEARNEERIKHSEVLRLFCDNLVSRNLVAGASPNGGPFRPDTLKPYTR